MHCSFGRSWLYWAWGLKRFTALNTWLLFHFWACVVVLRWCFLVHVLSEEGKLWGGGAGSWSGGTPSCQSVSAEFGLAPPPREDVFVLPPNHPLHRGHRKIIHFSQNLIPAPANLQQQRSYLIQKAFQPSKRSDGLGGAISRLPATLLILMTYLISSLTRVKS